MELRPPLHLGVVAIEKGAFGSPSTMVANFYIAILETIFLATKEWAQVCLKIIYIKYIYIYVCVLKKRIWYEITKNSWYAMKPNQI